MDKEKLLKLFRRKAYWEREKDKCLDKMARVLYWLFFATIYFFIEPFGERIKRIHREGWSFEGVLLLIVLIGILVTTFVYFFIAIFLQIRIQQCSRKLVEINQQILTELENYPTEDKQKNILEN